MHRAGRSHWRKLVGLPQKYYLQKFDQFQPADATLSSANNHKYKIKKHLKTGQYFSISSRTP